MHTYMYVYVCRSVLHEKILILMPVHNIFTHISVSAGIFIPCSKCAFLHLYMLCIIINCNIQGNLVI